MPAIAAALVRRQKRMRIRLQARQHTLTLRGNLRFPQAMPANGERQFTLRDVLDVPPISERGYITEFARLFGGFEQLGTAVNQLQSLLYAA